MLTKKQKGFTLVECFITLVILMVLFASGNMIISYSRNQTAKAFWLQKNISEMQNALRRISLEASKTSAPSAQVKINGHTHVFTYATNFVKESRGLRRIPNPYEDYNDYKSLSGVKHYFSLKGVSTKSKKASVGLTNKKINQDLLYFPVCTPCNKMQGKNGEVTWYRLWLGPSDDWESTHLGCLYLDTYKDKYTVNDSSVTAATDSLYELGPSMEFSKYKDRKPDKRQLLLNDVVVCTLTDKEIKSISGLTNKNLEKEERNKQIEAKDTVGGESSSMRQFTFMHLITLGFSCTCPKDRKVVLTNKLSFVVRTDSNPNPITNNAVGPSITSTGNGDWLVHFPGDEECLYSGIPDPPVIMYEKYAITHKSPSLISGFIQKEGAKGPINLDNITEMAEGFSIPKL